jgi:hypothetical protein
MRSRLPRQPVATHRNCCRLIRSRHIRGVVILPNGRVRAEPQWMFEEVAFRPRRLYFQAVSSGGSETGQTRSRTMRRRPWMLRLDQQLGLLPAGHLRLRGDGPPNTCTGPKDGRPIVVSTAIGWGGSGSLPNAINRDRACVDRGADLARIHTHHPSRARVFTRVLAARQRRPLP